MFVSDAPTDLLGTRFLEFFQRDTHTAKPKGIVAKDLEHLT
jgi:hypothetical protein